MMGTQPIVNTYQSGTPIQAIAYRCLRASAPARCGAVGLFSPIQGLSAAAQPRAGEGEFLNSTITANPAADAPRAAAPGSACAAAPRAAASPLRAVMLTAGAMGLGLLSAWIWMIGRDNGKFVLLDQETVAATLPTPLVLGAALGGMLGVVGVVWALLKDNRIRSTIAWCVNWAKSHPKLAILILAVAAFGAIDLYELFLGRELRHHDPSKGLLQHKTMLREDVKVFLLLAATVMLAMGISAMRPWCAKCHARVGFLRRTTQSASASRGWLLVAFLVPAVLGSALSLGALEGVPHFSDSLTYQMQGRMFYNGQLSMPAPKHPDLFTHSLFFVQSQPDAANPDAGTRYFGKYPAGWPAVLGAFDRLGIGFMANGVLAGLGALVTFGLARQVTTRRVAVLAAIVFALSPWAWFNGAHFASHVASMLAVNGFLLFFLRIVNAKSRPVFGSALAAGLCLGGAILVRPGDAAMFAAPAVVASFLLLLREPKKWLAHGLVITAGTCVGIAIYAFCNSQTTGSPTVSPYALEGRWKEDWNAGITSIIHRFQFQWSEMNGRFPGYGIGGMTLAVVGGIIAAQRGRFHRSAALWIIIACNAAFFIGNTPFLFTNVWWGPRWLLPVTPLLALLIAELVNVMLANATKMRSGNGAAAAAQFGIMALFAGIVIGLAFEYGGKWYTHRIAPPHNVSGAADKRVAVMGLHNVIVGMPVDGGGRAPFDARAGMVFMKAPLESNNVIYVRKVDNWSAKARECFPSRELYELIADKEADGGFVIKAVR